MCTWNVEKERKMIKQTNLMLKLNFLLFKQMEM